MSWRSLIWDSGTLASGTTATFKGRSCSGSGGTGNCSTWESSSLSVGGILTFTGAVSNERYLQIQADLASNTNRQNTPTVGEVDLTYQITSTLPSIKYYYLGGQRVAMRQGNEVYYLHGDHLGSTSLTTDITGTVVAQTRHHPFGEVRWESGSRVTDFGFTGQRNESGFGLMDYNARFYSAGLGRFVSADSIVPDFGNSQALNRYSYVLNNPLKFVDPSGHCAEWEGTSNGLCTHSIKTTQKIRLSNDEAVVAGPPQLKFIVRGGTVFPNETEVGFANYVLSGNEGFLPPPSGLPAMDLTVLNNVLSTLGYETLGNAFGFDILSEVIGGTPQVAVSGGIFIGSKFLGKMPSHISKSYNRHGQLTTGKYTLDEAGMKPHKTGSLANGKSQFLSNVDAESTVLDVAHYADQNNLWEQHGSAWRAKVYVKNGPVGVLGKTGELTNWVNIYKTETNFVHGSPGGAPK